MSTIVRRLILTGVGVAAGVIGGGISIVCLVAMGNWFLKSYWDVTNDGNRIFWVVLICIGLGLMLGGLGLGSWRWKIDRRKDKPLETAIVQIAVVGALIGSGMAIAYIAVGNLGVMLLIPVIQSQ